MKFTRIIFIFFLAFSSNISFSQNLDGEWRGNYINKITSTSEVNSSVPITLKFIKQPDDTYVAYTYTEVFQLIDGEIFRDTTICIARIENLNQRIFYVEEHNVLHRSFQKYKNNVPQTALSPVCFQRMALKYRSKKDGDYLVGKWTTIAYGCWNESGTIELKKVVQ